MGADKQNKKGKEMSRAKTEEEVKDEFLSHIRSLVEYWSKLPDISNKHRCDGVAFSILTLIDGSASMPAIDLHISPHEDDKAYHIENGENYYETNMMFNDCALHEEFYKK